MTAWGRTDKDAIRLFREAEAVSRSHPSRIVTDKLPAYVEGIWKHFYSNTAGRLCLNRAHFRKGPNNNLIERLNGSFDDRTKTMRGFETSDGAVAFCDAFAVRYDFLRIHETLGDRTPAVAAGIHPLRGRLGRSYALGNLPCMSSVRGRGRIMRAEENFVAKVSSRYPTFRELRGQFLTCVIGAKGADGSVVISDMRIMREYEASIESKIHKLWDRAILVGAGSTPLLDKLAEAIRASEMPAKRDASAIARFTEDIAYQIRSTYEPRMGVGYDFEAILMGLERFDKGDPFLRRILGVGISEDIKEYAIIGHGAPYAATLFRLLYDEMLTAEELGVLGSFVISLIARLNLDQTVGFGELGPDIVVLKPDQEPHWMNPSSQEFSVARESLRTLRFRYRLVRSVWPNIPVAFEQAGSDLL